MNKSREKITKAFPILIFSWKSRKRNSRKFCTARIFTPQSGVEKSCSKCRFSSCSQGKKTIKRSLIRHLEFAEAILGDVRICISIVSHRYLGMSFACLRPNVLKIIESWRMLLLSESRGFAIKRVRMPSISARRVSCKGTSFRNARGAAINWR